MFSQQTMNNDKILRVAITTKICMESIHNNWGKPWRPLCSSCLLVAVLSRHISYRTQRDLAEQAYFTGFHPLVWSFVDSTGLSDKQIKASTLHKS